MEFFGVAVTLAAVVIVAGMAAVVIYACLEGEN